MCCVFYQHRPNIENPLLKMLSKCHSTLTPFTPFTWQMAEGAHAAAAGYGHLILLLFGVFEFGLVGAEKGEGHG
jgi:hypothetical protein